MNGSKACWVLQCDIKKFFASINNEVLIDVLRRHFVDEKLLDLLKNVVSSFPGGLPLGNLTSQLLVNIYMNEFDQFMNHELKVKYYIRYADDFVVFSKDRVYLSGLVSKIYWYLKMYLCLDLHAKKVSIKTLGSGIDFLGWVHFEKYRVLRIVTRKRMLKKLSEEYCDESFQSYLGLISHGDSRKLSDEIGKIRIANYN